MSTSYKKGIYLALTTSFISGLAVFLSKIAVSISDPIVHIAWRTFFAAVALTVFMSFLGRLGKLKELKKKQVANLSLIGIVGGSLPFILFFTGLSQTSAATGALIHKTLYIWVALLAIPFLKEKLNFPQGLGYGLIIVSNLWVGGWEGFTFGKGEQLVLAATILWAIENVIAKKTLKTVDSVTVSWARLTVGSTIIFITALLLGKGRLMFAITPAQLVTILTGSTTLFLYVVTWYKALSLAPATHVSSILVLSTLITNLLSAVFITHKLPSPQLVGGIVAVVGIVTIIVATGKHLTYRLLPQLK